MTVIQGNFGRRDIDVWAAKIAAEKGESVEVVKAQAVADGLRMLEAMEAISELDACASFSIRD